MTRTVSGGQECLTSASSSRAAPARPAKARRFCWRLTRGVGRQTSEENERVGIVGFLSRAPACKSAASSRNEEHAAVTGNLLPASRATSVKRISAGSFFSRFCVGGSRQVKVIVRAEGGVVAGSRIAASRIPSFACFPVCCIPGAFAASGAWQARSPLAASEKHRFT